MLSSAGLALFRRRVAAALAAPALAAPALAAPDSPAGASVAVSPLSIGCALAMLRAAAAPGGDALRELDALLAFDKRPEAEVQAAFKALGAEGVPGLHLANSLWANAAVRPEFAEELCCLFSAEVHPLAGKDEINCYIKDKTHGLIPSLLAHDPDATVLLNVLAIKFEWFRKFNQENSTKNTIFYGLTPGRECESRCHMMNRKGPSLLPVIRSDTFIAVLVPYANGAEKNIDTELVHEEPFMYAALFVLPKNTGAPALVAAVEEAFADVAAICADAGTERVLLSVPAFRIESGAVSLRGDLESLGVKTCFTPAARLERMTADGTYASDVVHSVVIEVDENGTKAAAATAVCTTRGRNPPVLEFKLDRPFAFAVLNTRTSETLFATVVTRP
jgi:serpin B